MAARQLSRCCSPALWQQLAKQASSAAAVATCSEAGWQQASGRQHPLFQHLLSCMRRDVQQRAYSPQAFQPSRLYPRQHQGSEAAVFWGLVGTNVAVTILAKADQAEVKQLVSQHFRASVEAVSQGRLHTLLSSSVCHSSAVHCGVNLLVLLLYRWMQPLSATELLVLYVLGALVGSCTHVAYCWYDAGGPDFGLKYALNTPGLYGCSGAVAAITAYKAALQPLGLPSIGLPLPLPVALGGFLYCCMYIREADYSDYTGKFGAAAFGLLAAAVAVASGRRRLAWS